jgi:hypothetical protein
MSLFGCWFVLYSLTWFPVGYRESIAHDKCVLACGSWCVGSGYLYCCQSCRFLHVSSQDPRHHAPQRPPTVGGGRASSIKRCTAEGDRSLYRTGYSEVSARNWTAYARRHSVKQLVFLFLCEYSI